VFFSVDQVLLHEGGVYAARRSSPRLICKASTAPKRWYRRGGARG